MSAQARTGSPVRALTSRYISSRSPRTWGYLTRVGEYVYQGNAAPRGQPRGSYSGRSGPTDGSSVCCASQDEARHAVRRIGLSQAVPRLQVRREVDGEGHVAAEGNRIQRRGLPADRRAQRSRQPRRHPLRGQLASGGVAQQQRRHRAVRSSVATTPYAASTTAVSTNGAAMPCAAESLTVVSALIAVPPMPAPKTPMAVPRRSGANHALTNGTPTAKAVPAIPRKKPPTSRPANEECPTKPRYSTGTMVANDTAGNITRPPSLSVRAPTGTRPRAPTITGTATISACWNEVRCSESFSFGASGLSSAQAQKFMAKPTVARASIRPADPLRVVAGVGAGTGFCALIALAPRSMG